MNERYLAKKYHIQLFDLRLDPHTLPEYRKLTLLLNIFLTAEKPFLIHCLKGVDRTGLASAIALILGEDASLARAKEQFSWKFGVLPFYRSTGPYFFSQYEKWLETDDKKHSRDTFLTWIHNVYTDHHGNLEFWVDHVNGIGFQKKTVIVPALSDKIILDGWAFDARTLEHPKKLAVAIDGTIESHADFVYDRSDVARFFHLGEQLYDKYIIGWKSVLDKDDLQSGCHTIALRMYSEQKGIIDIPTEKIFCL